MINFLPAIAFAVRLTCDLGREPNEAEWAHCLGMSIALLKRFVREGQLAKEKLILANLRLVVSVAKRFQGNGMELMDLIQVRWMARSTQAGGWRVGREGSCDDSVTGAQSRAQWGWEGFI